MKLTPCYIFAILYARLELYVILIIVDYDNKNHIASFEPAINRRFFVYHYFMRPINKINIQKYNFSQNMI